MAKNNVNEISCPACGAPMKFDAASGKMLCEWCGTTMDIEPKSEETSDAPKTSDSEKEVLEGFDFASLGDQAQDPDAEDVPIYHCKSCGAELIAPPEQMSMSCPYCGSNVVLTQKVSGKLRPDGLIPFKIDAKSLPDHMKKYYRDKVLLPRKFFSESTMGKITGVYVPFWVFSGNISGSLSYRGEKVSSSREGDYIVTTTSEYDAERDVSMNFENVPVDASGKIKDELMDSIEPFDMSSVVDFDMRYLAGFVADRFDEAGDSIADRAKKRMFQTAESAVQSRISGYTSVRKQGGHLTADIKARYLLFPVYRFKIRFDKKKYEFAVNGQTGKVVGTLPTDRNVCIRYYVTHALYALVPVVGAFVAWYLMGR
ncbi:MAG: hydrogenase maturation nickel metallochaperone HypA [Lachnospiraceae bacterium]|nr:hydrogenase maturation nickel metallochaperone HypA [Lachnospiraceae bacterium]